MKSVMIYPHNFINGAFWDRLLRIEYIERLENMNTTIYEAVAKYKKDDTLPYTEYFSLGYFLTKDLAENAIMLAK